MTKIGFDDRWPKPPPPAPVVEKAAVPRPEPVVVAPRPAVAAKVATRPRAPFVEEHPSTIVLHCSDGRFTAAVGELLADQGCTRYDVVAFPGGPALLHTSTGSLVEAEASRGGASFLIKAHKVKTAYLIAHEGCGFYRNRYAGQGAEWIRNRQRSDLQAAAEWFRRVHPGVETRLFIAVPEAPPSVTEGPKSPSSGYVDFVLIDRGDPSKFSTL